MKSMRWNIIFILLLLLATSIVYFLQIKIFGKTEDTFFYFFQDLAFIPLQVLLVTIFINEILKKREKKSILNKMNMAIGAYFSEMGDELLTLLTPFDSKLSILEKLFDKDQVWDKQFVLKFQELAQHRNNVIEISRGDLLALRDFLSSKRSFVIGLLQNANLLEHQSFTELIWAVTHLTEELALRKDLGHLSEMDASHLANDIERAYSASILEWISYMIHVKENFPFIFSLHLRLNPFDKKRKIEFD